MEPQKIKELIAKWTENMNASININADRRREGLETSLFHSGAAMGMRTAIEDLRKELDG
jgi:hypothetical protein